VIPPPFGAGNAAAISRIVAPQSRPAVAAR